MEKELFCCLCQREYSQGNLPRLFPGCGHTYCENCIRNLMGFNKQKQIRIICPQDHIEMKFDQRDINHFPKNISLIKLMNNLRRVILPQSPNQSRDDLSTYQLQSSPHPQSKSPISSQLKSIVSEDTLNQQQICLIHQKPLQIVCIQHRTLICSNCAIFGEHKGHDFKSVREMDKDKIAREQSILRLIDSKEEVMKRVNCRERRDEENRIVQLKREMLAQEMRAKYSKLYDLVRFSEKKSAEKLARFFTGLEERLKSEGNTIQQPLDMYRLWEQRAMKQVDSYQKGSNLQQQVSYLGYDNPTSTPDILSEGTSILTSLEQTIKAISKNFDETIQGIDLVTNEEVDRLLVDYVSFKDTKGGVNSSSYRKKPSIREIRELLDMDTSKDGKRVMMMQSFEHINQEMLLETERNKGVLQRSRSRELLRNIEHQKRSSNINNDPIILPDILKQSYPKQLPRQFPKNPPLMTIQSSPLIAASSPKSQLRHTISPRSRDLIFNPGATQVVLSPKRKLKLLIPDKYNKVVESIYMDVADTADFTGAQLGQQTTLQVLEILKGKKVKNLKLIRNKLSDAILQDLWGHLTNIQVLNLSQNYFTDRVVQSFISNMSKVPYLKNLVLSQNKINARNVKHRVEELRQLGITVSL